MTETITTDTKPEGYLVIAAVGSQGPSGGSSSSVSFPDSLKKIFLRHSSLHLSLSLSLVFLSLADFCLQLQCFCRRQETLHGDERWRERGPRRGGHRAPPPSAGTRSPASACLETSHNTDHIRFQAERRSGGSGRNRQVFLVKWSFSEKLII